MKPDEEKAHITASVFVLHTNNKLFFPLSLSLKGIDFSQGKRQTTQPKEHFGSSLTSLAKASPSIHLRRKALIYIRSCLMLTDWESLGLSHESLRTTDSESMEDPLDCLRRESYNQLKRLEFSTRLLAICTSSLSADSLMECSCYLLANCSYNYFILPSFYAFLSRYLVYIFSEASYFSLEMLSDDYCFTFYDNYLYLLSLYSMEAFLILSNYSDCSLRLLFNCSTTAYFSLIPQMASSFSAMNWPDSIILEDSDYCSISFSFFTSPNSSLRLTPSFFHIYDSVFNFLSAPIASLRSASLWSSSADLFFYASSIFL